MVVRPCRNQATHGTVRGPISCPNIHSLFTGCDKFDQLFSSRKNGLKFLASLLDMVNRQRRIPGKRIGAGHWLRSHVAAGRRSAGNQLLATGTYPLLMDSGAG